MARSTLPLFRTSNDDGALDGIAEVLRSGWIGEGEKVKLFEQQIGEFIGNSRVIAVNSCTSALVLALRLAGVDSTSEVISTPMTCTATNHAILQLGAKIVWADIDPLTGNIDPASVSSRITERTRAVMVVHWGGVPCDMDALHSLRKRHSIRIIEDAAHAFGSAYKGRFIGESCDFACYSFQAIKTITTGDGGAIVCGSSEDNERARLLRWFGIERGRSLGEYDIEEFGYKFHMNDIAAVIGISGMRHLRSYLQIRRRNGLLYQELLDGVPGLHIHKECAHERSAFWLANLVVEDRANFIRRLSEYGIAASPVHLRNNQYKVFKQFNDAELPGVDYFDPRHVSVPVGHWVTEEDVEYVSKIVSQGW